LNGLAGEKDEEDSFSVGHSLKHGTLRVTSKTINKNGVQLTIWDTPGLEGGENDTEYLSDIKEKCSDFDIFFYCIKCAEKRATDLFDKKSTLCEFTKLFGVKKLWRKAVVILTHCNDLVEEKKEEAEYNPEINVEEALKAKVEQWKSRLHEEVAKLGYRKVQRIPVLPAAFTAELPGYPLWFSKISESIVKRAEYKAKMAVLRFWNDRIIPKNEIKMSTDKIEEMPLNEQPFVVPPINKKLAAAGIATAGVVSTAVGAGVGATIGALLIGIPSFGVFAGVGLVVGGAIGGVSGLGMSAATASAIHYARERKRKEK
jgi:predicted GTPase